MPPRLYKDQSRVCIYEEPSPGTIYPPGALPAAITNPHGNLDDIYWHSSLDYFEIAYDRTISVALPSRSAPPGSATHSLPDHNLGFLPFGVLIVGNTQIPTGEPIQGASAAARHVALGVDSTNVWIREAWNYAYLAGTTISFRAILFRPAGQTPTATMLEESPNRVAYGRGKFSTDKSYLKSSPSAPDFWMTRGRTIDTIYAKYRGVRPNGAVREFNGYSGSFAGSGFFGVAD